MSTVYDMTEAAGGGSATATGAGWTWHPDADGAAILDWCRANPAGHAATSEYGEDVTGAEVLARVARLGGRQATDAETAAALHRYGWLYEPVLVMSPAAAERFHRDLTACMRADERYTPAPTKDTP